MGEVGREVEAGSARASFSPSPFSFLSFDSGKKTYNSAAPFLVITTHGRKTWLNIVPAHPVRDVHVGHGRDQEPHAGHGVVGGRHVRRRLPIFVTRIFCGAVREQHLDALLERI